MMFVKNKNPNTKKIFTIYFPGKIRKNIQSDNLFEVFHINLERQEIGIFYIDRSSSGNTK